MLLIITANPSLDRTMVFPGLRLGVVQRTNEVLVAAGGKGLNVARAAHALNQPALVCAPLGGHTGEQVAHLAADEGLLAHWTSHSSGETRTCILLVDPRAEDATALNEAGPVFSATDWAAFVADVLDASASADLCVVSGSLPQGIAPPELTSLIGELQGRGQRVLVDTSGPPLEAALAARPWGVKVNSAELGAALGQSVITVTEAAAALSSLHLRGIEVAAVSMGANGCVAADANEVWWARPPLIRPVSSVGSGDSLLAGLATGLLRGLPLPEALRLGVACGTADALTIGGGLISLPQVERLAAEVRVAPV